MIIIFNFDYLLEIEMIFTTIFYFPWLIYQGPKLICCKLLGLGDLWSSVDLLLFANNTWKCKTMQTIYCGLWKIFLPTMK